MTATSDRYVESESVWKVDRAAAAISHDVYQGERVDGCFSGYVRTPQGLVQVHAGRKWGHLDALEVPYPEQWVGFSVQFGDREYYRRELRPGSRRLTPRGAAIVAGRWVREIVARLEAEGGADA